jgi:hypothetical protein
MSNSNAVRRSCTLGASSGGGVLPDAAALAVGAYACHRVGLAGQGVRVGLSDSGVGAHAYFTARSYRVEGLRTRHDGHGTGMAAVLLAVAPDATIVSFPAGATHLAELLRAVDVDLILCAWGVGTAYPEADFGSGPPVIAADIGLPGVWPAVAVGVTAVRGGVGRPSGPYSLPAGRHRWSGPSVAAAACCGLAALAISAGHEPRRAVRLAASFDVASILEEGPAGRSRHVHGASDCGRHDRRRAGHRSIRPHQQR